jgi:hypothetical protein
VNIFSRDSLTGELQFRATNEVGPRWNVDLLSVTFNPSGDFSPIGTTWAKLSVTGTVQAIDGVFGTMTLMPDASTVIPENVLVPSITGMSGTGGAPAVGDVLTANIGAWIGAVSYSYNWKVGGTAPGGTPANVKNYTPVTADLTKTVTVEVIGTNSIGPSTAVPSAATLAVVASG